MTPFLLHLPVCLLTLLAAPTLAALPYNPARIFAINNGSGAYILSQPTTSQAEFHFLNTSDTIDVSKPLRSTITNDLPFLSSSSPKTFTPFLLGDDLIVVAGDCDDGGAEMWHYTPDREKITGRWDKLESSSMDFALRSYFLSAAFFFSPTGSLSDASFYLFGGMCPNETSTADQWTLNAAYSNAMLSVSPHPSSIASYSSPSYDFSILTSRGPPVPEAGLTITPLTPTYSNTSSTSISQQQNFVLIGGHTQQAFINMSQVALFSLPEESWSFQAILQSDPGKADLMAKSSTAEVEPRSGHTAVLTTDGSKIVIFGGWVGDISTPAQPQLAILELGRGYGGVDDWRWTRPATVNNPFNSGQGIYGHGAAMLEGDVMLVYGGHSISSGSSKSRRQDAQSANTQMLLFNVTSLTFVSTYTNPSSPKTSSNVENEPSPGPLTTASQKAGLGAGLVLGFSAVGGVVVVYLFYSRRLRQKRSIREKELRELALGAGRFCSGDLVISGGVDGRGGHYSGPRTASWGSREEKQISTYGDGSPWAPVATAGSGRTAGIGIYGNGERDAERTGLLIETPSPTRGLRRPLHSKAPTSYNTNVSPGGLSHHGPSPATGDIHTIAEQDEESEAGGSLRRPKSSKSRKGAGRPESGGSDPFKDPPPPLPPQNKSEVDRLHREHEIQGWVEDWEAAGTAMESGRLPHSSLSSSRHEQSQNNNNSNNSRSDSPDKSDRTGSNLSEWSTLSSSSIQRSLFGTISRNVSMRSASAGYTLFANAAAAMTGRATLVHHPGPGPGPAAEGTKASAKRSTSLNLDNNSSTCVEGSSHRERERADTVLTAKPSLGPSQPGEKDALLETNGSSRRDDVFETPPDSPIRDRGLQGSSLGPGRKALGWMGSMRRALTGTTDAGGAVRRRVEEYEQRNMNLPSSSSKDQSQMRETSDYEASISRPRRAASASAAFWRGKKGAKDWDAEPASPALVGPLSSARTAFRRKPVRGQTEPLPVDDEDEADEWDVEAAVQKRLVQVMFTVPKEKLRVVNADQLSLVSKSDVDGGEGGGSESEVGKEGAGKEKGEASKTLKRVSTVVEEDSEPPPGKEELDDKKWKGKGKG